MGIKYDPVKRSLGRVFNTTPALRILFYRLLDLLLLRSWYINRELRLWARLRPRASVLDAGSGFGQYVYRMATFGPQWTIKGVDVKTEQIADCNAFFQQVKLNQRVAFEWADLVQFDEPERYDLVLSVDVMEHIEEDERVFANFARAMRPGAMLLISTPSDQGGSDVHDHDHEDSFIDEHVRDGYAIDDLRAKLQRAGFERIDIRYSYGRPGNLAWRLSMKYPLLLLDASKLFFVLLPLYYVVVYPLAWLLNRADLRGQHATGTGLIAKAYKPESAAGA